MLPAEELRAVVCSHSPILGLCEETMPVCVVKILCLASVPEEQFSLPALCSCVGPASWVIE